MSIPSGFLLINKPAGPTSHDIIDELRRITGERRIGHAGTLDPFASGLLIVAVGREATRRISQFSKMDKTYVAKLHLGATSDTFDRTGRIQNVARPRQILSLTKTDHVQNDQRSLIILHRTKIEKVLKKFVGEQTQIPPMYSAKKIHGKKLYELARKGIEIEREPVKINIHYIKLLNSHLPTIFPFGKIVGKDNFDKISNKSSTFLQSIRPCGKVLDKKNCGGAHLIIETRVSSGTYIRSLAHDIGQALGCGAYLEELCRTEIARPAEPHRVLPKPLPRHSVASCEGWAKEERSGGEYKLKDAIETKNLTPKNWEKFLFMR